MSRNAGPDSAIYKTVDGGGDLDEADERTAHGPHRQDRSRYLREESGDRLRGDRQRQPGCVAGHAWRMHGRTAGRARGRRDVSHRQRRRELDESKLARGRSDAERQRLHRFRRRGLRRLHAGAHRSEQRQSTCSWSATRSWTRPTAGRRGAAAADHVRQASSRTSSAMCAPSGSIRRTPNRMIIGDDGGFALSYDGGKSSDHISHLPVGETYGVGYDMEEPYNIYASLQDHEDWKGPSIGPMGFTSLLDWFAISSGDGMHTRVDPADGRWVYTTSEWGRRVSHRPEARIPRQHPARTRPGGGPPYRFIWGTPLHLSPHNGSILYTGGEVLLKSVDRGDHWTEISPDLSTNDPRESSPHSGEHGVQLPRYWMAISTIAESPVTPGVIWVGTSDGKVHLTKNGGGPGGIMTRGGRRRRADRKARSSAPSSPRRTRPPARTSRKAATRRTTSIRTCMRPTISARPGARSRATCRTSRFTSSGRTTGIPICCSSGPTAACSSRSTAGRHG